MFYSLSPSLPLSLSPSLLLFLSVACPPIDFNDNQDVLDLIGKNRTGLLAVLDEEVRGRKMFLEGRNFCRAAVCPRAASCGRNGAWCCGHSAERVMLRGVRHGAVCAQCGTCDVAGCCVISCRSHFSCSHFCGFIVPLPLLSSCRHFLSSLSFYSPKAVVPRGSSEGFYNKIQKAQAAHPRLEFPKTKSTDFVID